MIAQKQNLFRVNFLNSLLLFACKLEANIFKRNIIGQCSVKSTEACVLKLTCNEINSTIQLGMNDQELNALHETVPFLNLNNMDFSPLLSNTFCYLEILLLCKLSEQADAVYTFLSTTSRGPHKL